MYLKTFLAIKECFARRILRIARPPSGLDLEDRIINGIHRKIISG
ncbi:hypothetical protein IHE45_07G081800 [Dioscorea alata]|uniref:Uncharacterized protein n=1 Tax=Dioscorea alata TaxID=55571 RepID=A0ACB7VSK4_DIOAL|nr:hypothetical protein IHE45_07G081800 [Dioscorea alata]